MADPKEDEQEALGEEEPASFFDFKPRILQDCEAHFLAIFSLNLTGSIQEKSYYRTNALQSDEDQVHCVRNFAGLIAISIKAKIDSPSKYLASKTVCEPIAKCFSFIPRLRLCNSDRSFGHPKDTC